MNRDQKAAVIEEIAADITASQAIFAIDYRGISVAQADTLRARLREADAVFRVVKNSLTERAAEQAGAPELMPLLQGPTALTFVRGDAAAAAKAVADFTRATQLLAFKGGLMDGAALSGADVTAISRLPSREVLYGQLVGLIANPLAGLARTLNALIGGLAVGLGGVLSQKQDDPAFAVSPAPVSDSSTTENATLEGEAAVTDQVEGEGAAEEEAPPAEAAEPAAADSAAAPAEEAPPAEADESAVADSSASTTEDAASEGEAAATDQPEGEGPSEEEAPPAEAAEPAAADSAAAPAEEAAPAEAAEEAAAAEPEAAAAPEAAGTEVEAAEADSTSPDKDQGDALAESDESAPEAAAETEAEATAETETDDGSAPEPSAGDDEKE
jgi:large subunit ribosomal protein L10